MNQSRHLPVLVCVGKVGTDSFGTFLRNTLIENQVDVSGMVTDPRSRTTLAVVAVDKNGERTFSFYRDPSADGAYYRFGGHTGHIPGVKVTVGDTNGAGDTFFGAALAQLCKFEILQDLTVSDLETILTVSNKAAAITTSRHGAIPAMPTYEEVFSH